MTVFTSTLKACRILSFQKAFMQIGATIKLCFKGLSTFIVEFTIVFIAFSSFFYFVLKNHLENFLDFVRTVENTIAMSIGKFNFSALKSANELAAWIFFAFSRKFYSLNNLRKIIMMKSSSFYVVVVNLILINMMMAIINLAFEEIKANKEKFKNKFELIQYMKRSLREMIGIEVAEPIVPIYLTKEEARRLKRKGLEAEMDPTDKVSEDFTQKTDALLQYIKSTYLADGFMDNEESKRMLAKMNGGAGVSEEESNKVAGLGFDALFMQGGSSATTKEDDDDDVQDDDKKDEEE